MTFEKMMNEVKAGGQFYRENWRNNNYNIIRMISKEVKFIEGYHMGKFKPFLVLVNGNGMCEPYIPSVDDMTADDWEREYGEKCFDDSDNNKTYKIFISQPMRGKSADEIEEERKRIIEMISERYEKYEIIDSHFKDFDPNKKPLYFLSKSIDKLSEADVLFAPREYVNHTTSMIEVICALEYGIELNLY